MPQPTMIAEQTPNRGYPVPVSTNKLAFDVNRLRMAITAVDGDIAQLIQRISDAASLDSPTFTNEPRAPTAVPGTNSNVIATTAFVMAAIAAMDLSDIAPVDSPSFSGTPTAPTADMTDNSGRIATTAFVQSLFAQLIGAAPEALNTVYEIAAALQNNPGVIASILTTLGQKASQADLNAKLTAVQPFIDAASGATVDLGSVNSQNVRVTGSIPITSFGTAPAGTVRNVRFTGSLTLTHNPGSLVLPGAGNIQTSSNDTLTAVSLGSGAWIVTDYQFANPASGRNALQLGNLATANFSDVHGGLADFTASRLSNTAVLNNTGKWLIVMLTHSSAGAEGQVSSDTSSWGPMFKNSGVSHWMMVPPNWFYRVIFNGSLISWLESRG